MKRLLLVIIATVAGSGVCGTGFARGSSRTNAQGMVRHRVIAIATGRTRFSRHRANTGSGAKGLPSRRERRPLAGDSDA